MTLNFKIYEQDFHLWLCLAVKGTLGVIYEAFIYIYFSN